MSTNVRRHGEFLPWIKENCQFNQQTASRYMRAFTTGKLLPGSSLGVKEAAAAAPSQRKPTAIGWAQADR